MNTIDYKLIGQKIKEKRKEQGYSQESLAELCQISTSYLGHIERGSRKLSMDVAIKIAHHLNISLDYLLLDAKDVSPGLLTHVEAILQKSSPKQAETLLRTIRVLSENIDKI